MYFVFSSGCTANGKRGNVYQDQVSNREQEEAGMRDIVYQ